MVIVPPPACPNGQISVTLNMFDSYGDGWNGNTLTISSYIQDTSFTFTLPNGSFADTTFCMPDNCYNVVCDSGSAQSEVGWVLHSSTDTLVSGGAPFQSEVTIGSALCPIHACTDTLAVNYDPSAAEDDGSCIYPTSLIIGTDTCCGVDSLFNNSTVISVAPICNWLNYYSNGDTASYGWQGDTSGFATTFYQFGNTTVTFNQSWNASIWVPADVKFEIEKDNSGRIIEKRRFFLCKLCNPPHYEIDSITQYYYDIDSANGNPMIYKTY